MLLLHVCFSALYISVSLMTFVYVLATVVGLVIYAYYHQVGCDPLRADYINSPNQVFMSNFRRKACIFHNYRGRKFLPARRYASAGYRDRNVSVRPSVCPSVTRRYCVKTKKASGMISSPSGSTKTLVFRRQISSPNSEGFPPNGGLKQGSVGKIQRFFSFKRQYLENRSRYGKSYY